MAESRAADRTLGLSCGTCGQSPGRAVGQPDLGNPAQFGQDHRLFPVGETGPDGSPVERTAPVAGDVDGQPGVAPAASAVELGETFAEGLGGGVLEPRVHRGSDPQAAGIDAVASRLAVLAEALDQVAADLFDEIAPLLAELDVGAVGHGPEPGRRRHACLCLGHEAVVDHLAEHVIATVKRLLGGANRVVVARCLGQDREIGGFGQG